MITLYVDIMALYKCLFYSILKHEENEEMASNAGSLSAVQPVLELSNCSNKYGLMPSVHYVYCMWAWLKLMSATCKLCVQMQYHGVLLSQLRQ